MTQRRCTFEGCPTLLSRYNPFNLCRLHGAQERSELAVSVPAVELMTDLTMPWHEEARCRTSPPELFFSDPNPRAYQQGEHRSSPRVSSDGEESNTLRRARQVCAPCPVKRQCAEMAFVRDAQGTWAGSTYRHRRALAHLLLAERIDVLLAEVKEASLHGPYRALNHANEWRDDVA